MPNKTVLFHTSENDDMIVCVQRSSRKGVPHARSEVVNLMQRYRGTHYKFKGQGTEIEYMHKAVKWNRMYVHVQRTSLAE